MNSVIGLDVHPVAVLMAKANVLLALAPELKGKRDYDVHLPVYMADTLQTAEKKGKTYLAIPDGTGRDFAIPLKSLELNRDLDTVVDNMTAFARRGVGSDPLMESARKGFLGKIRHFTKEEISLWNINFALMVDLIKNRQDTVWGFILKNAFRPAYLRRTKVDVVIGNPPWLSFRDIAEPAYKGRIKELTFGYCPASSILSGQRQLDFPMLFEIPAAVGAVGKVGIARVVRDFQGRWEGRKTCFWFSSLSTDRLFPQPGGRRVLVFETWVVT